MLVFDTTAPVLHLACRHHGYECHIKNVSKLFRLTNVPDHALFKKISEELNSIDFTNRELIKFTYGKNEVLDNAAKKSLAVISGLLKEGQLLRGNYCELAELVQFYLRTDV